MCELRSRFKMVYKDRFLRIIYFPEYSSFQNAFVTFFISFLEIGLVLVCWCVKSFERGSFFINWKSSKKDLKLINFANISPRKHQLTVWEDKLGCLIHQNIYHTLTTHSIQRRGYMHLYDSYRKNFHDKFKFLPQEVYCYTYIFIFLKLTQLNFYDCWIYKFKINKQ